MAFFLGFICHYIFDIIPHGDTKAPKKYHNIIYITLAGLIDLAILTTFLLVLMVSKNELLSWPQIAAILGSVLPDAFQLIYFIFPQKQILKKIQKFHFYFHDLFSKKKDFNLTTGITLQIIIFIIFQFIIF